MIRDSEMTVRVMTYPPFNAWLGIPDDRRPPASIHDAVQRSFTQAKERQVVRLAERSEEALRLGQRFSAQEAIRHSPSANMYDLRGLVLMMQS